MIERFYKFIETYFNNPENFKVYTYPTIDLTIKVIIGIFIAYYLNRKSNQDKLKEKSIDTFSELIDNIAIDQRISYLVLNRRALIYLENSYPLSPSFNEWIQKEKESLSKEIDAKGEKYKDYSFFASKFQFLIGKIKYSAIIEHENIFLTFINDFSKWDNKVNAMFDDELLVTKIEASTNAVSSQFNYVNSYFEEHLSGLIAKTLLETHLKYYQNYIDIVSKTLRKL